MRRLVCFLWRQDKLDLIFLDIQLADGESFAVFEALAVKVPVIFCTAYDEYVLKAFKNNGIDYILKPIREQAIVSRLKVTAFVEWVEKG